MTNKLKSHCNSVVQSGIEASIRAGLLPWYPGQYIFRHTVFSYILLAVFHLSSVYVCFICIVK